MHADPEPAQRALPEATAPPIEPRMFEPRLRVTVKAGGDLHICPSCSSDLVYPVDWTPAGERWLISRRCPECEWRGSSIHEERSIERFDLELERGSQLLIEDLRRVGRANFAEYTRRFAAALHEGAILPEDF